MTKLPKVLALAETNDRVLDELLDELRRHGKVLKVALKLAGCNQDDVETRLLNRADLLLNPDLPEADMLAKINSFFN